MGTRQNRKHLVLRQCYLLSKALLNRCNILLICCVFSGVTEMTLNLFQICSHTQCITFFAQENRHLQRTCVLQTFIIVVCITLEAVRMSILSCDCYFLLRMCRVICLQWLTRGIVCHNVSGKRA